jgi:hypothetical protein
MAKRDTSPSAAGWPEAASGEPMARSPLWLDYSGLPEWLNGKVSRSAWLVFKKVVELDCARNTRPATIEITPAEIAEQCGLPAPTVMRTLEGLRRKKCLALFLPEHAEERALIEVRVPLPTPRSAAQVRRQAPFDRLDAAVPLRYAGDEEAAPAQHAATKKDMERTVDLYFNTVGFKMNTFVLDELRLVSQRFSADAIEKAFARARKNGIRSLSWVVRELYRRSRRHVRKKT